MRSCLWIYLAAGLTAMAGCTAKNDKLGTTNSSEPAASDVITDAATSDGDASDAEVSLDAAGVDADVDPEAGPTEPLPHNCIEDWPEPPNAQPVPSLSNITPAVLWTKPVPQAVARFGDVNNQLVWTGTHLAFSGANKLWILEPDGEVSAIVNLGAVQFVSEPVADDEGTIYFGSVDLYAVRPDGSFKWTKPLGPNVSPSVEMTRASAIALSPDGILYLFATDGYIYAVRSEDGSTVWKRPLKVGEFLQNGSLPHISSGIGDTIYIAGIPHLRATGEPAGGPLMHEGIELTTGVFGLYSQKILATRNVSNANRTDLYVFNACGDFLWSHRGSSYWVPRVVLFEDRVLIQEGPPNDRMARIYSATGEHLLGPAPMAGSAWLAGADGLIYAMECADQNSEMTLVAYSPALDRLWSLDLEQPCYWAPPVLADDGKLYVLRGHDIDKEVSVTAIQTPSPGLANTSKPNDRCNNRRTRWLGR